MTSLASALAQRIETRTARTGVIGLGYVGLPLALEFARSGLQTTGIDLDPLKVAALERGESYIGDVDAHLVASLLSSGHFVPTVDYEAVATLDTVNICVPTPLRKSKDPDMSFIVSAVSGVAAHLRPGTLVVLESTTYPGTTEELVKPLLERTGLRAGIDFFLAFSPERVDPGNPTFHTRNVPKVVGGITDTCTRLATLLYSSAIERVVPVSSPAVAEMVKLLENTFRAVNIGLVNEIALMCDRLGIDVWEVVDAARTKPFGFMPFYPGPGLGGHCIPIDPFYLSWKARQSGFEARFIELAGQINGSMPSVVVERIADALNCDRKPLNGSTILIVGVAYKANIDDIRESPALDVMSLLHRKGARVQYADPFVPKLAAHLWNGNADLTATVLDHHALQAADCVAVLTDHRAIDYEEVASAARRVVDTRNAIKQRHPHVHRLGAPSGARSNPELMPTHYDAA